MLSSFRRSPVYVLCFICLLAAPQIGGLVYQFNQGFRPFVAAPHRVPFSWDMFANRVERCIVSWTNPLQIGEHRIRSLREVEIPIEWDVIFDYREDYKNAALGLCSFAIAKPTSARLQCFMPNGVEINDEIACPP